jgi:hypothetical protein
MADFSKIDEEIAQDEQSVDVPLDDKAGNPYLAPDGTTPAFVCVLGSDAQRVRLVKEAQTRKLLRQARKKYTPQDLRTDRIEAAAAAITAWSGWTLNGEPWPCTPENVKQFLRAEHILVQIEDAIARHAAFFMNNSPS